MAVSIVEIMLVDVSPDVNKDLHGEDFPQVAETALSSCVTASKVLETKRWSLKKILVCGGDDRPLPSLKDVKERLLGDVNRYVKAPDKYMALTSLLLKSQAFYLTHGSLAQELPVIDLPRTHRGKPFIPVTVYASEDESIDYPLSVSHQFPFCGVARFLRQTTNRMLGMDIVVFDSFNRELYDSDKDFVKVFRESFTDWEWRRIHSADNLLIEFYLRWAMKEAYTKALGLGLHLDFSAFETRLELVDELCSQDGIWSAISTTGTHLRGSVVTNGQDETSWDFYFLPLFCENIGQGKVCACICFGPLCDADASFEARTTLTTIHNLIQWHQDRLR